MNETRLDNDAIRKALRKNNRLKGIYDNLEPVQREPTGLAGLDYILKGGLPKGRIIGIYGEKSVSKTTLMLQIVKEFQARGLPVAFSDAERTMDEAWAQKIGVNTEEWHFFEPDYGEQTYDSILSCSELGVSLFIVDSLPQLIPMFMYEDTDKNPQGAVSRLFGQRIPKIITSLHESGMILVFINQVRTVSNGHQMYKGEYGGYAYEHALSLDFQLRKGQPATGDTSGIPVTLSLKKNKLGRPGLETTYNLVYDQGIDVVASLIDCMKKLNLVTQSGAWFYLDPELATYLGWPDNKLGQGVKAAIEKLGQPEVYRTVYDMVCGRFLHAAPDDPVDADLVADL